MSKFGKHYPALVSRNDRDRLLFLAAAGLALSLLILVVIFANLRGTKAQAKNTDLPVPKVSGTVTLLAPEKPVRAGSLLSEVRFKEVYWPRNQVPEDAILDISEFSAMFAKSELPAGVPVQRSAITREKSRISLPLTPGNRAVTIEGDETSLIEGHALPGTKVDVVLTYYEEKELTSKVIVQNARVLSYGGDTTPAGEESATAEKVKRAVSRTITLDVSVQDALKIQTARQMGRLSLVMRDSGDIEAIQFTEITQAQVGSARTDRKPKTAACNRGKMKMGDKEYIIDCEGNIHEAIEDYEP